MTIEQRLDALSGQIDSLNSMVRMLTNILNKKANYSMWLTEKEAMAELNIGIKSIRNFRKSGVLKGYSSTGRNFKYKRSEIEAFQKGEKANDILKTKKAPVATDAN